jgi:hypothetical protein
MAQQTPGQLREHARKLYQEALEANAEAEVDMAQSEILERLALRVEDLDRAESELLGARQKLAAAQAGYERPADDLAEVEAQLAAAPAAGSLPLEERIQAHQRRMALDTVRAELLPVVKERKAACMLAADLVTSLERDSLPWLRAAVTEVQAAYESPPLDDFSKLAAVAPETTYWRAQWLGGAVLMLSNSPAHRTYAVTALAVQPGMAEVREKWLEDLLGKLDRRAGSEVLMALGRIDNPNVVQIDHQDQMEQHRQAAASIRGTEAEIVTDSSDPAGPRAGQVVQLSPNTDDLANPAVQARQAQIEQQWREYSRRQGVNEYLYGPQ